VQQVRIRRLHAAGKGEFRPLKKGHGGRLKPLPGSIRSLAKLYKVSPRLIQRVINRGRAEAAARRNERPGGADHEQRKKRERDLAVRAVRELLAIGERYQAEQLRVQFNIRSDEVQ
jgi:hypothetical protein